MSSGLSPYLLSTATILPLIHPQSRLPQLKTTTLKHWEFLQSHAPVPLRYDYLSTGKWTLTEYFFLVTYLRHSPSWCGTFCFFYPGRHTQSVRPSCPPVPVRQRECHIPDPINLTSCSSVCNMVVWACSVSIALLHLISSWIAKWCFNGTISPRNIGQLLWGVAAATDNFSLVDT